MATESGWLRWGGNLGIFLALVALGACVEAIGTGPEETGGTGGAGGTGGGTNTGGAAAGPVTVAQVTRLWNDAIAAPCACVTGQDALDCRAVASASELSFDACETSALSVSAAQSGLACMRGAADDYEACTAAASCVSATLQDCARVANSALLACDFPATVLVALDDCAVVSGAYFTCFDGSPIPLEAACDGFIDCGDGSDESGC